MHTKLEGRTGDEDQLDGPEPRVGDGVVVIVAHVVAAGLAGVAVEVLLLVAPDLFASHQKHQESEDENNGEPMRPNALQEGPVHAVVSGSDL
uniref:Uncharacterized protein n=1 Tax=Salarias fasciatus TaxID=181472 RepID=A0A672HGP2_SALFA